MLEISVPLWLTIFAPLGADDNESAIDIEEGDITDNLVLSKPLDVKEYGKQVIEYTVSDSDGNTTTFERIVEVVWNYDVQFIGHQGSYYGVPNTEEAILNSMLYAKRVKSYNGTEYKSLMEYVALFDDLLEH